MTEKLAFRLEGAVVRLALALLRRLSPATSSNLGGALARFIGPRLPVSRTADANLRLVMPELDEAARRHIIRGVWDNLGRTTAELPHVPFLQQNDSGPGWEVEGAEHLYAAAAHGGPIILVSGHISNWEVLPLAISTLGVKLSFVYRPAANPIVDRIILDLRAQTIGADVPQFPKGAIGARAAMAHLRKGGHLGMLVDQKMNDGIAAPFFGRLAMTAPATAAFALRFRCPVIAAHAVRLAPARFRVIFEAPLKMPDSGDKHADIATLTTTINAYLERCIRARPGDWLWLHRRWTDRKGYKEGRIFFFEKKK